MLNCTIKHWSAPNSIPVKYHGFAVSLTILAMKSRSHANYVIPHAFQLKQIYQNKYFGFMNNTVKPLVSFRLVRSPVCGFVQVYNLDVVMKLYRIVKNYC